MKTDGGECYVCGEGYLTNHVEYDYTTEECWDGVTRSAYIPLFHSICDTCGSHIGGPKQVRMNAKCMKAFRKGHFY